MSAAVSERLESLPLLQEKSSVCSASWRFGSRFELAETATPYTTSFANAVPRSSSAVSRTSPRYVYVTGRKRAQTLGFRYRDNTLSW